MNYENMVSERRHKRPHIVRFHVYEMSIIGKFIDTKQISDCQRLGEGRIQSACLMGMGFLFGVMKMFCH